MSIGPLARGWFNSKFGITKNKVYASKYYLPHESWPKVAVWWKIIPFQALDSSKYDFVNILCQTAPSSKDFHYLKVPIAFINEYRDKFHKINGQIDIYLSAEADTLFVEIRGKDRIDFRKFLVE